MKRTLLFSILLIAVFFQAHAQLSGTKTIPSDYATLAAAITALNTQGVGAGGVTFNVAAGHAETAPAGGFSITATGTVANPIIFQKSGAGVNPTFTAFTPQASGTLNDGVLKIIGGDYITIDGFTLQENAGNTNLTPGTNTMTEWGIAVLRAATNNGAKNITLQHNTITLKKVYRNSFGIYSNVLHAATTVTTQSDISNPTGSNSNLKIYSNNISDVNMGIIVVGSYTAARMDMGLDIGGGSAATGNTVTDFGTNGAISAFVYVPMSVNGIYTDNQINSNISYNSVASSNGGVTANTILRGIFSTLDGNIPSTGSFFRNFNHNNVSIRHGNSLGTISAIEVRDEFDNQNIPFQINHNDFNNTTHTSGNGSNGSTTYFINTEGSSNGEINENTFTDLAVNTTDIYFISLNSYSGTGTKNVNNNSIINSFNASGGGEIYFLYDFLSSSEVHFNDNLFSNIIAPSKYVSGVYLYGGGAMEITGNTFDNIRAETTDIIYSSQCEMVVISHNIISNILTDGEASGISCSYLKAEILNNRIYNINSILNAGNIVYGMYLNGTDTFNVNNNLIGNLKAPNVSNSDALRGIYMTDSDGVYNISNNTIYIDANSTNTPFGTSAISGYFGTNTGEKYLRNNILVNLSTPKGSGKTTVLRNYSTNLNDYGSLSDNNLMYAGVPGPSRLIYYHGSAAGTDQTLPAFQARVFPRDSASISENPNFLSLIGDSLNFLHIDPNLPTAIESGGKPVAGITDDYDGDLRNATTPDIGADEFTGCREASWYADVDGDGWGDPAVVVHFCNAPVGYVGNNLDCDDDLLTYQDNDGDGFGGAPDTCGITDNSDCDDNLLTYQDIDGDGFGSTPDSCGVTNNADCDDNLLTYLDDDGDGFGGASDSCGVIVNGDCNDENVNIYPTAAEICNETDDNCNTAIDEGVQTTFYVDTDGDNYGDAGSDTLACNSPAGYVANITDCNDANSGINPGATETCNAMDDDCDGMTDESGGSFYYADADGDTYGDATSGISSCIPISGYVSNNSDCNDTNSAINPAATELACNGIDENCDGMADNIIRATLPYFQSFETTWLNQCGTKTVPALEWRNSPATGNNSWRRSDQPTTGGWTNPNAGRLSNDASDGNVSARFHSSRAVGGTTGDFDLYLDLSSGDPTKQLSFNYRNNTGTDAVAIMLSEDNGFTFSALDTFGRTGIWTYKSITFLSTSGLAVLRFRGIADFGTTDFHIDAVSVVMVPNCAGAPIVSTTLSSENPVCTGDHFTLSLSMVYTEPGIAYQWQSSPDNNIWTTISGATGTTYTTNMTGPKYYRSIVTCVPGSAATASASVLVSPRVPLYAGLPYFTGFENNWLCGNEQTPSPFWQNSPGMGNSSWRKYSTGATAGWTNPSAGGYNPISTEGQQSARFHALASVGSTGNLDLYLNLSSGNATKVLTFDHINISGADSLKVYLSSNGGLSFNLLQGFRNAAAWTGRNLVFIGTSATSILRIQGKSSAANGGTDIGMDNLRVAEQCNGVPAASNALIAGLTSAFVCESDSFTVELSQPYGAYGLNIQWQSSADNITFVNIPGAIASIYTSTMSANIYFRAVITCTVSGLTTTSASALAYKYEFAPLPYTFGFENSWLCTGNYQPSINWTNVPLTGNNSWRRNDEGATAGWVNPNNGAYTPASSEGTYSARFHSRETTAGELGKLDLYLDLNSGAATKVLHFDHINNGGADSLKLYLSTDGGATFSFVKGWRTATAWTARTASIASSSATSMLRFEAKSSATNGGTDIGLDNISINGSGSFTGNGGMELADGGNLGSVSIFPVPTNGSVTLEYHLAEEKELRLTVTDVLGRTLRSEKLPGTEGVNRHEADLRGLAPGVYFFTLEDGVGRRTVRGAKE